MKNENVLLDNMMKILQDATHIYIYTMQDDIYRTMHGATLYDMSQHDEPGA